jgi:hypothetical protein
MVKDVTSCVVDSSGKFAVSVSDAGGQFANGVIYTLMHFELLISSRFFEEKIELYRK